VADLTHPDLLFTVQVDYTTSRPVVPDEHRAWVQVMAFDDIEAELLAHAMVAGTPVPWWRPRVVMVTRLTTIDCIA
jgi:hypothetical protein